MGGMDGCEDDGDGFVEADAEVDDEMDEMALRAVPVADVSALAETVLLLVFVDAALRVRACFLCCSIRRCFSSRSSRATINFIRCNA